MPQLFLEGWITISPGEGQMRFHLPPGTTGANFEFTFHNPDEAAHATVTGSVVPESVYEDPNAPPARNIALVMWTNNHYSPINVDYSIAPFSGLGGGGLGA